MPETQNPEDPGYDPAATFAVPEGELNTRRSLPSVGDVFGDFEVVTLLGRGGMGAVLQGRNRTTGADVAIKVILSVGSEMPAESLARFKREMAAMRKVDPKAQVVHILGSGTFGEDQLPYAVMDFVRGGDLAKLLGEGRLPVVRALELMEKIALAVHACHVHGVLHRDLKPANVLIRESDGEPIVADFGLARVDAMSRLTKTGDMLGTPLYMSPEQALGLVREQDARTDVYGLGAMLYECLTGQVPFDEPSPVDLMMKIAGEQPKSPLVHVSDLSPDIAAIALKCLAKEKADRYASALELAQDLARARQGEHTRGKLVSPGTRAARFLGRNALVIVLGLAIAGGLAGGLTFVKRRNDRQRLVAAALDRARQVESSARDETHVLEEIRSLGALPDAIAEVESLLAVRTFDEASADLARVTTASRGVPELQHLVELALLVPERACLVGEGGGFALGDALLERREALLDGRDALPAPAASLLDGANRLAAARLGRDDPAAKALRAYAALAAAGAPTLPLGPGRLDLEPSLLATVTPDLEAARALPGAPGERAAWLLVDLLVLGGPNEEARARAALEKARQRAPDAAARPILERVVTAPPLDGSAGKLVLALGASPTREAVLELSRVLARAGLPDALERPELATPTAAKIAGLAARDPASTFAHIAVSQPERTAEHRKLDDRIGTALDVIHPHSDALSVLSEGFAKDLRAAEDRAWPGVAKDLAAAFALSPWGEDTLRFASDSARSRTSRVLFRMVQSSIVERSAWLVSASFSAKDRALTRAGVSSDYFAEDTFEPRERTPLAACEEFDRRLDADLAKDRSDFLGGAHDATFLETLETARLAARGLRRYEALVETETWPPGERERIVSEAFEGFHHFARLGGPLVLPFRAHLRRLVFPGVLGDALAALDLERARRAAESSVAADRYAHYLLFALSRAVTPPLALEGVTVGEDLFQLTKGWAREDGVRAAQAHHKEGDFSSEIAAVFEDKVGTWSALEGVGGYITAQRLADARRLGGADAERIRAAKYVFERPKLARR